MRCRFSWLACVGSLALGVPIPAKANLAVTEWSLLSQVASTETGNDTEGTNLVQNPYYNTIHAQSGNSYADTLYDMSWSIDAAAFNITSDHYMAQLDGRVSTSGQIYITPAIDSTLSLSGSYDYDWPESVLGQAGLAILIYDFATEERIYDQGVQGDNIGLDPPHGTLTLPAATVPLISGHDYIINFEALTDQFNAGPMGTSGQSSGEIHFSITPCAEPAPPAIPTATPDRICVGQTSALTASVGPGQTVDWYTESCGGSLVPGGASPVVSPDATQTYYARARVISSGCVGTTCSTATVTIADGTGDFDGGGVQDSDLPTFVDILLSPGAPQDCIADMNGDGTPDGLDVQMWTDAYRTP